MAEYDDSKEQMTQDFHVRVGVTPVESDEVRLHRNGTHVGLYAVRAKVLDGPEMDVSFDPGFLEDEDGMTDGTLATAISAVVNGMTESAIEAEAYQWSEEHKEAYVVVGGTGDQQWMAKAFLNRDLADRWCGTLNAWCESRQVARTTPGDELATIVDPTGRLVTCPHDKLFRADRGGVEYAVNAVPLDTTNAWR